ncbi:MAG TPA: hypothetical protein VFR37_03690, partial [Longimicrobium sp.]|nr:hypothetical protein [Longimicrobium sp.]
TPLSGPLQTTVVYFNNQNFESLTAFPGGFAVRVENPPAGTPSEGVFTSAGYAAITVRDGAGREARNFSAPIQVSVDVPSGTVDPETGVPVKNGDVVPYWSYEPATGQWRYEGQATLAGPNGAGNFTATVAMNHLTFLNLDWRAEGCVPNPKVHIIGNYWRRTLWYYIRAVGSGIAHEVTTDSLVLEIGYAPLANEDVEIEIEARDPSTGMRVGLFRTRRLCPGPHQMTVTLPGAPPPQAPPPPSITVTLRLRCGDVIALPWGWVRYRKVGDQGWLWGGNLRAGNGVIRGLEPDTRYEVTAAGVYAGVEFSGTTTVTTGADGSDTRVTIQFEVDRRLCARLRTHDQGGGGP